MRRLPTGWSWSSVGDLAAEGPANGYSGPVAPDATGSRTLRLSATTSGVLVLNQQTTKRLVETIPTNSDLWLLPGDLLVQRSNTLDLVGTAAIYDGPPQAYVYPDLMMRLRIREVDTTRFVCRYLNSSSGRDFFRRMAAGSSGSMPKISGAKLRSMPVPLPPLSEQRRIAEILDRAEALRAKRREALALLDTLTQTVFLEMFGDPVANPKGWPVLAVSDFVEEFQGGKSVATESAESSATRHRILKISAVTGMTFVPEESKPVPDAYLPPREHFVRSGDLLFSRANTTDLVGAIAFVKEAPPNLLLPDKLWRFVWRRPRFVDPLFIWALFQTPALRHEIGRRATGTSGSMKNISQEKLLGIRVVVPPLADQERFSRWVGGTAQLKATQRHSDTGLAALFASLQHRAFRGEL